MLSKTQNKYIRSLALQKFRKENKSFLIEGEKIVMEWVEAAPKIKILVALEEWIIENKALLNKGNIEQIVSVTAEELQQLSALKTAHSVLAVVPFDTQTPTINYDPIWSFALDQIKDPGNMGTILRIADWFGVPQVICSNNCVDVYNPKVIQAAMGAHLRVHIFEHQDLAAFIQKSKSKAYACVLGAESVYHYASQNEGIILIGNESKGLDPILIKLADQALSIPKIGGAESLNAAVSAGIICSILKAPVKIL